MRQTTEGQPVNRFLAIVGASGSGKSSVARAGLIAALKQDAIAGSAHWPVTVFRPGPDPLESLAVALSRSLNVAQGASALSELIETFKKSEKTLHLIARQLLAENALGMRLVILADQFEEVFTLSPAGEVREALIRNLLYAAKVVQGQTVVIVTMRADFYGKCAVNSQLAAAFSDHHVLVGPMSEDELRRAIERPTRLVGCELEPGLVDLLLQDVHHQRGALPLLQHALLELWNKREGRRLTVKAYEEIGKLEGALQKRADATLKGFSQDEQERCRQIFLRLTQPGEGTEDTKRRVSMQELESMSGTSSDEEAIIQKLANASLLTTEGDITRGDAFVEVAHEALIRNWPQLRKWVDVDRAGLRTRTRLTEAAREWKNAGREATYLYSGARLAVAEEWAGSHPKELSADEGEFLRCSREAHNQREANELAAARKLAEEQEQAAKKLRRRAIWAAGAAVVALILLAVSVVMWRASVSARAVAEEQARIAESRRLAAQSSSALAKHPQRSLLLAIEAVRVGQSVRGIRVAAGEQSLREALEVIGGRRVIRANGPITAVAISPDNHWVVTGSKDNNTAHLWDVSANDLRSNPVILRGHAGEVTAVAISSDNHWVVTGSKDNTARLWDLSAKDPGANSVVLRGHAGVVAAVAISPDSHWIVTASYDNSARLWDLSAKDPRVDPVILRGHEDWVKAVAISPDSHWVVTGSDDNTARLWDLRTKNPGANPVVLRGHESGVTAVVFSPDNHWVVTASNDETARLWDLRAKDPAANPVILRGHKGEVTAVAISPDNHWIVTTSKDNTARLWDLRAKDPGSNPLILGGHDAPVAAVAISPDNHWVVTASFDNTGRVWDLRAKDPGANPVVLRGHEHPVAAVAISPDNHWVVTASYDNTARVWDLSADDPGVNPVVLRGHGAQVNAVAISSDNHWLVTASSDGTARLWLLQVESLIEMAYFTVGRNFFADEWQLYFPGVKYRKTFDQLPDDAKSVTQKNN